MEFEDRSFCRLGAAIGGGLEACLRSGGGGGVIRTLASSLKLKAPVWLLSRDERPSSWTRSGAWRSRRSRQMASGDVLMPIDFAGCRFSNALSPSFC